MPIPGVLIVLFAVLGAVFGSFGSVLVGRIPHGESIGGRSRCPRCKHTLGALELIPILSYLFLLGRCRHCRRPISLLYPLLEVASGLLFVLALAIAVSPLPAFLLALSFWALLLIAVVDAKTQTIPDAFSLPLVAFALAGDVLAQSIDLFPPLLALAFFGGQWALSRGKWVGSGDILLGVGIGFLLNDSPKLILCLGLAYVLGAIAAVVLLITRRATRRSHVPFGPFLAVAAVITVAAGNAIIGALAHGMPW